MFNVEMCVGGGVCKDVGAVCRDGGAGMSEGVCRDGGAGVSEVSVGMVEQVCLEV